jgi:hypothetical protein
VASESGRPASGRSLQQQRASSTQQHTQAGGTRTARLYKLLSANPNHGALKPTAPSRPRSGGGGSRASHEPANVRLDLGVDTRPKTAGAATTRGASSARPSSSSSATGSSSRGRGGRPHSARIGEGHGYAPVRTSGHRGGGGKTWGTQPTVDAMVRRYKQSVAAWCANGPCIARTHYCGAFSITLTSRPSLISVRLLSHGCATGMRKTTTRALGKLTSTPAPPPVLAPQREPAPPPPPQLTGRADAHRLHQRLAASHRPLRRLPWSSRLQRHNFVSLPQLRRHRHPATVLGQAQGGRVRLRRHCRTSRGQ